MRTTVYAARVIGEALGREVSPARPPRTRASAQHCNISASRKASRRRLPGAATGTPWRPSGTLARYTIAARGADAL